MDLLKRELAPILPEAWAEIDREATRVLRLNLAGRKLVDFIGPLGWQEAAVNTGHLRLCSQEPVSGVATGVRVVQPLVELRTPFLLPTMALDTIARGARDTDLAAVIEAAERIARAEDDAIFNGYSDAAIAGMIAASPHQAVSLPGDAAQLPRTLVEARERLREAGVDGPYALALGPQIYKEISQASEDGYPIRKRIERTVIDGPLVRAPAIQGAVLLSVRGGDFELTVGQDHSIGYAIHDKLNIELYLTESFTFRVLEPAAAIYLNAAGE